jgi:hypothetical protein
VTREKSGAARGKPTNVRAVLREVTVVSGGRCVKP